MKPNVLLAILLIAGGVAVLAYQGFNYTTREKVVDIGDVHVMADKTKSVSLPPILGAFAIAGGILLLALGNRKA
jgi:hypothetical protein